MVYVKNVTGRERQYRLQLTCEEEGQDAGVYSPGLVTVEAGQTVALDISQLIDEMDGAVVPTGSCRKRD